MPENRKIIVVGGNAAGPAAAAKAKRTDKKAEVILFEQGAFISTGTCEMPYVLSGEIESYKNIVFFDEQSFLKEKGVKVYTGHRVEDIDRRKKIITVTDLLHLTKTQYRYDSLILATGSHAFNLPGVPENAENVFFFKQISDLTALKNYIARSGAVNASVIGAGYIGLEAADALHKLGLKVSMFEKALLPLPQAEGEIGLLIKEVLEKKGVSFSGGFDSENSIIFENNRVTAVNHCGRKTDCQLLLICPGVRPSVRLAESSGLRLGVTGAIKVDRNLRTNDSSIYACGDCIEVEDFVTSKPAYIPIATISRAAGHIAGENAAGGRNQMQSVIRNMAVKFFDNVYASAGITALEAKRHRLLFESVSGVMPGIIKVMPGSQNVFGKLIYERTTKRILGASFFGAPQAAAYADIISVLIRQGAKSESLKDMNFNYTPPVSPFINLLNILGSKIK